MTTAGSIFGDPVSRERISCAEGIQRVGKMLFGKEWIAALTAHEQLLQREYYSIDPRELAQTYGIGHESVLALHRANLQGRQHSKVYAWIEDNGLASVDGITLDRRAFETALEADARYRPDPAGSSLEERAVDTPKADTAGPNETPARKRRASPQSDRAGRVISELYPGGVPSQTDLSDTELCHKVGKKLSERGLGDVSNDSILRAAGRRK